MRKTNTEQVGKVLELFLKRNGLSDKVLEMEILKSWESIVGDLVAKKTVDLRVSKKRLTVKVNSAPLKNELEMSKSKLVELINNHIGNQVIDEVAIS